MLEVPLLVEWTCRVQLRLLANDVGGAIPKLEKKQKEKLKLIRQNLSLGPRQRIPITELRTQVEDLEGLQETPVFFEKGMAARETPTTMNNWKNNKSKNQTPRMPGTSSSRVGRSANGISASDQIFVFGNFSSLSSNPVSGGNASSSSEGRAQNVREAYRYITGGDSSEDVDWVWKIKTSERCRMFLWLAVKDKLLTNSVRVKRQLTDDGSCMACGETHESVDHILKHCDVARVCWRLTHTPSSFARGSAATFSRWLRRNCSSADMVNGIPWGLTFSHTCWELWKARNRRIFEQVRPSPLEIVRRANFMARESLQLGHQRSPEPTGRMRWVSWSCPNHATYNSHNPTLKRSLENMIRTACGIKQPAPEKPGTINDGYYPWQSTVANLT
nr:LINE-type retrotransposon LIb DNA [Ipomoea batatas]